MRVEIVVGVAVAILGAGGVAGLLWLRSAIGLKFTTVMAETLKPQWAADAEAAARTVSESLRADITKQTALINDLRSELRHQLPPNGDHYANGSTAAWQSLKTLHDKLGKIEDALGIDDTK